MTLLMKTETLAVERNLKMDTAITLLDGERRVLCYGRIVEHISRQMVSISEDGCSPSV